jgi:hypothetical protein
LDVFEQLRKVFDGADSFIAGGHAVRGGGSTRHAERVANIPAWANSDAEVRSLLLKVFPKLETDERQRKRAAIWMLMIYYYFRMGLTRGRIALKTGWTPNRVNMLIRNIKYAANGRQSSHGKIRTGRRWRKKIGDLLPATNRASGDSHSSL